VWCEVQFLRQIKTEKRKRKFTDYGKSEKNGWRRAELRSPERGEGEERMNDEG
jgi:hypothetical protein